MFTPKEIAANYVAAAKTKTSEKWYNLFVLAILAGAFIAFGAALATFSATGFTGMQASLIKGAVFPVGLILVVVCGAELFTGNCLLVAPVLNRDIKPSGMFRNWGLVFGGNIVGGVLIAVLVVGSHAMSQSVAESCVAVAAAKCDMNFGYAILRGVLCNMLVCLAVWASMSTKSTAGKALAVYLPVFAFVVCGFEHSVANVYYLTSGLMASAVYGITATGLSFGASLLYCLIPSTIGNIIGGAAIAVCYHVAYRPKNENPSDN